MNNFFGKGKQMNKCSRERAKLKEEARNSGLILILVRLL